MATSPSLSMKKGSERSMNMMKKTGNLRAMKNMAPLFTQANVSPWGENHSSSCIALMLRSHALYLSVCQRGFTFLTSLEGLMAARPLPLYVHDLSSLSRSSPWARNPRNQYSLSVTNIISHEEGSAKG